MLSTYKNNINWLAQCKKRMYYPVDRPDYAGLTAFEYGWKSFNNLYSEFKSGPDREKMRACFKKYVSAKDFFEKNRKSLIKFCDIDHHIYMMDDQYGNLGPKIGNQVLQLKEAIDKEEYQTIIENLMACLYTVRNARIHGSFGTGETRFVFLPKSIYEINISILTSKLHISRNELETAINKALSNLKKPLKNN